MSTPDLAAVLRDILTTEEQFTASRMAQLQGRLGAYPGVQRLLQELTPDQVAVLVDAVKAMELTKVAQEFSIRVGKKEPVP